MIVDLFRQSAVDERRGSLRTCARFRAQTKQIGRRTLEVAALAIDEHMFEQALTVPAREIAVGEVGDLFAQLRFDLFGTEGEVVTYTRHALALELERAARFRGKLGAFQFGIDAQFSGLKLPGGYQVDDRIQLIVVRMHCRWKSHGQKRGQHRCMQAVAAIGVGEFSIHAQISKFHEPLTTGLGARMGCR